MRGPHRGAGRKQQSRALDWTGPERGKVRVVLAVMMRRLVVIIRVRPLDGVQGYNRVHLYRCVT